VRLRVDPKATARRLADAARGVTPGAARYAGRSRRTWLALATATALLAYAALLLWPYDWEPAGYVENQAESLPDGGIRFAGPGIARTPAPPEWVAAAMDAHELEVQLQVRPLASKQTGPARIMTMSLDHHHRDFTIGQEGTDLILRLRTPASDLNGKVDGDPVASIPNVFRFMRWVTIGLRIEPGQLELAVDGELAARRSLPADPLENWDPSYRLALGNELTHSRPWLGEIRRAVVRAGDSEVDYARSPALETPENFWLFRNAPRLIPFQYWNPRDLILNVILFLPLGVLIGAWLGQRTGRGAWRAILLLATISAAFEMLQLFVPGRITSIDDVTANTLGGALGVLLLRGLSGSPAAVSLRPVPD
jgi:VanZ like family